jgi:predicted hydrocarbon binding protein
MIAKTKTLSENPFQYLILGLQEILSPSDLEKLTTASFTGQNTSFSFDVQTVKKMRRTMNEVYGETGARGLLMCSGRAAFTHLLDQQGKELGFEQEVFRFASSKVKLKRGLELLAKWMGRIYSEEVSLVALEKIWSFEVKNQQGAAGEVGTGLCDFTAGLLQGFLFWAGGGKFYRVRETICSLASGDACCFAIDKSPLD